MSSFSSDTAARKLPLQLQTSTKGIATAVRGDSWTLEENNLPLQMGFGPWSPQKGPVTSLSAAAVGAINSVAEGEINQDYSAQTNLDRSLSYPNCCTAADSTYSMYFSGKALAKVG